MKAQNAESFFYPRKPASLFILCCIFSVLLRLSNATTEDDNNMNFIFPSFDPNNRQIVYQNDSFSSDNAIQLTVNQQNKGLNGSAGWATYYKPMHLWDNSSGNLLLADFTTHFSFVINSFNQSVSADGFAFFLAPNGSTIPPADSGGGHLALESGDPTHNNFNFVAVEFDTFSSPWDPHGVSDHVAIDINTVEKNLSYVPWGWSDIENGGKVNASISYNSATKNLSVFLFDTEDISRASSLSIILDLSNVPLPEWVTFGFSGTTGSASQIHTINSWNFSSTLQVPTKANPPTPPPEAAATNPTIPLVNPGKKSRTWLWVVLGVVGGAIFVLLSVLALVWLKYRRRESNLYREEFGKDEENGPEEIEDEFEKGTGPRKFTYKELHLATDEFNDIGKLGEGGFGGVYKGFLKDSNSYVAIKRVSSGSKQGLKEYGSEVKIISRLRHRNLVQLIGWCHDKKELLLVYEYMSNGSLDSHLFKENSLLTWEFRKPPCLFILCCILLLPLSNATTEDDNLNFIFTSFNPNLREIVYQGNASSSDNAIQLTVNQKNKGLYGSAGWATYYKPMHLWDNSSGNLVLADFTTHFSFVIDSLNKSSRADGFAFFLAPNGSTIPPPDSSGGGHLALENADPAFIHNQFVAVEFDTYSNKWDPDGVSDHVAIDLNTVEKYLSYSPWRWSDIENGGKVDAFISYNSTTKNLSVLLFDADDISRVNSSSLSFILDLSKVLPDWVTFGFSGTTGSLFEIHTITSWNFNSSLQVVATSSSNKANSPTPAPEAEMNQKIPPVNPRRKSRTWLWVVLGIAGGAIFALLSVLALLWFFCWREKYKHKGDDTMSWNEDMKMVTGAPREFLYRELRFATSNFTDEGLLGEGGFAPECLETYKTIKESDIYSFGVVALEIASGKQAISVIERDGNRFKTKLVEWVWELYGRDTIFEAADPRLSENYDMEQMERLLLVGLACAHPNYFARPTITQVIDMLGFKAQVPTLPLEMPASAYIAAHQATVFSSSASSSSHTTASNRSQAQFSGASVSSESSKVRASSGASTTE
ncbi:hypothetical protein COLO4_32424 [Corchorus olitorius]|uniref:non-specific serine/threonine protein kinase n=1 Tax=Corchorus olitorius TaxID=93759 RepID=A0A1R3GZC9_9ROSI|nr:hypothetical protein COLO4_32424 [Corchorus olitorius]